MLPEIKAVSIKKNEIKIILILKILLQIFSEFSVEFSVIFIIISLARTNAPRINQLKYIKKFIVPLSVKTNNKVYVNKFKAITSDKKRLILIDCIMPE